MHFEVSGRGLLVFGSLAHKDRAGDTPLIVGAIGTPLPRGICQVRLVARNENGQVAQAMTVVPLR